jgi:hypothetical protein
MGRMIGKHQESGIVLPSIWKEIKVNHSLLMP